MLRGPKAQQQPVQKQIQVQRAAVPTVCRLQPGFQHPAHLNDRAASAAKVGLPVFRAVLWLKVTESNRVAPPPPPPPPPPPASTAGYIAKSEAMPSS